MRQLPPLSSSDKAGICLLEYADTNSGKTASAITGIPKILYINKEEKDARLVHSALHPQYYDIMDHVEFDGFYDEMEFLNNLILQYGKGERPYETIFHDGLTFSMVKYKQTTEDQRFALNEKLKKEAEKVGLSEIIIDRTMKEWRDWDVIAGLMAREANLLNKLSKFGLLVVSTAISTEYPKWNQSVKIAPSLIGKEFPKIIHGLFDTIGYIVTPFHISHDGQVMKPKISFVNYGDDFTNTYMCRASGLLIEMERRFGPQTLNLAKIAAVIRGEIKF